MSAAAVQLVRYDAMRSAIAAAHSVDEVKDIHDRALALEAYARQANDEDNIRRVTEIRIRAERRCGELLRESEKAKGGEYGGKARIDGRRATPSNPTKTLSSLGISKTQSSRWQKLAAVPPDEFEATFAPSKPVPSTSSILSAAETKTRALEPRPPKPEPVTPVDEDALWLWGRLLDFERNGLLERDPADICDTMLPHMRETIRELAPQVARWLEGVRP